MLLIGNMAATAIAEGRTLCRVAGMAAADMAGAVELALASVTAVAAEANRLDSI